MRASFEVNNAAASVVFSAALVSFTFGVLLGPSAAGWISRRVRFATLSGLAAFSLLAASVSPSYSAFVFFYGFAFGFSSGALYNHALSNASASSAPNVLLPVNVAAFGLGGAVFGPLTLWLAETGLGLWSTLPATAFMAFVALASLVTPYSRATEPSTSSARRGLSRPDGNIAVLWTIFATGSLPGLIVLGFASQIVPEGDDGVLIAGIALVMVAVGNTTGRLAASLIAGKFGPALGVSLSLVLTLLALVALLLANRPGAVVAWLFLAAFAYGHLAANIPLYVRATVRPEAFSGVFGWVFTGWGFAGLAGPWIAGLLLDRSGTFRSSLTVCVGAATLGLILIALHSRSTTVQSEIRRS